MYYVNLNLENRYRMNGICNNDYQMEWEDSEFMEILLGKLPEVRRYQNETEFSKEIIELKEMYNKYDYMKTDKQDFLEKLQVKVDNIQKKNKYWNGLNVWYVQECLERQKFCLVSGNGGIGKSFFVKCLEERLDEENIEHLCIYGKFEKDISRIPFEDIEKLAENKRFVFVIDALNEMEQNAQRELYSILMNVKRLKGLQVVITYRSHTLEKEIPAIPGHINCLKNAQSNTHLSSQCPQILIKLRVRNIHAFRVQNLRLAFRSQRRNCKSHCNAVVFFCFNHCTVEWSAAVDDHTVFGFFHICAHSSKILNHNRYAVGLLHF